MQCYTNEHRSERGYFHGGYTLKKTNKKKKPLCISEGLSVKRGQADPKLSFALSEPFPPRVAYVYFKDSRGINETNSNLNVFKSTVPLSVGRMRGQQVPKNAQRSSKLGVLCQIHVVSFVRSHRRTSALC